MVSRRPSRCCDDNSISTYHGCTAPKGSRAPESYFSTASRPSRTISSNDVTPGVPSAPMNRFLRSYPVLSFFSLLRLLSTRPSASTTSSPSACWRATPQDTAVVPPALVERLPPTVQVPSLGSSNG